MEIKTATTRQLRYGPFLKQVNVDDKSIKLMGEIQSTLLELLTLNESKLLPSCQYNNLDSNCRLLQRFARNSYVQWRNMISANEYTIKGSEEDGRRPKKQKVLNGQN